MSVLLSVQLSSSTGPCYHSIHMEYSCKHYEVATLPPARFTKRYPPLPPPFPTQTDLHINHTYSPTRMDKMVLVVLTEIVNKMQIN